MKMGFVWDYRCYFYINCGLKIFVLTFCICKLALILQVLGLYDN